MQRVIVAISLLGLLSAAFDTVDPGILLCQLQRQCGFDGTALQWATSFMMDRKQQVHFQVWLSLILHLDCSVLGPTAFLAIHGWNVHRHWKHSYADDTRLYFPSVDTSICGQKICRLCSELDGYQSSETAYRLIWTGTRYQLAKVTVSGLQLQSTSAPFCSSVTDLGVAIDAELMLGPICASRATMSSPAMMNQIATDTLA